MTYDHNEDIVELLVFTRGITARYDSTIVLNALKELGWLGTTGYDHPVDYIKSVLGEKDYMDSVPNRIEMFYNDLYEMLVVARENTTQCGMMDKDGAVSWSTVAFDNIKIYPHHVMAVDPATKRPF